MLNSLSSFPYTASNVKVPHLYLFDRETNTQILEDIRGVVDLKTIFLSPTANDILFHSLATSIGRALGSWHRSYHSWVSAPSQTELRADIGHNEPMRKLKYLITYDSFIKVLDPIPGDNRGSQEDLGRCQGHCDKRVLENGE